MNNITASPHPAHNAKPQGRADPNHVPTPYYGATPATALEHNGGPMLSRGTHPDHSAWQMQHQANDGVVHSFHPPATYWPPGTYTAQALIPTQYSHTSQSVDSGTLGPASYQATRPTVMPTSVPGPSGSSASHPIGDQVGAPYGSYHHGQVDSGIQAVLAPTQSMFSAATLSQVSGAPAYSTYHHAQGVAMDASTAYPYGQSSATSVQAAAAVTYAAPPEMTWPHANWAQLSGVTEDTRAPALAGSAQPQDTGVSSSIPTHTHVETQGASEARQAYAAPILPVVFHSYHDGPRMSITVELYPRSEMPVTYPVYNESR